MLLDTLAAGRRATPEARGQLAGGALELMAEARVRAIWDTALARTPRLLPAD